MQRTKGSKYVTSCHPVSQKRVSDKIEYL